MAMTGCLMRRKFQHTAARRRLDWLVVCVLRQSRFQHTAARRRLGLLVQIRHARIEGFNTQPPEGGWSASSRTNAKNSRFQHTAARRRLGCCIDYFLCKKNVSTHSRPKAAGYVKRDWGALKPFQHTAARRRLAVCQFRRRRDIVFQHTAARRRLGPENAGAFSVSSFNTQPPEGGWVC